MVQFEWHDGTVKNIHVDPPFLYEYQVSNGSNSQKMGCGIREWEGGTSECGDSKPLTELSLVNRNCPPTGISGIRDLDA